MSGEGFFKRWSRLKATGGDAEPAPEARPAAPRRPPATAQPIAPALPADAAPAAARAGPTLDDVARLTPESDFSAFVGQGVDKSVQRLALKKLFADPHFKVMDGLDMYMDDYNKPSPVSAAMLAALDHARGALRLPPRAEPAQAVEDAAALPAGGTQAAPDTGLDAAPDTAPNAGAEALPTAFPDAANGPPSTCAPQAKGTPASPVDAYTAMEDSAAAAAITGAAMPASSPPQSLQGPA